MSLLDIFKTKNSASKAAKSKPGYIGLDIASHCVHLCQLRPLEDGRYSIIAKISIEFEGSRQALLESPQSLKKILQKAFKEKPFVGRKVIALMPLEDVKIMLLSYKSKLADVDAEIVKMIGNRIEGDVDDHVIDYLTVRANPSDDEHMSVVSVAHKDKVATVLNALTSCGLEVVALDIAPAALRRMVATLYSGKSYENVLLINTGLSVSYLTIVSGRRLLFDQSVDFGVDLLIDDIAKALDITAEAAIGLVERYGLEKSSSPLKEVAEEADMDMDYSATLLEIVKPRFLQLIEEINRVLIFTSAETRGAPITRVCLLGGIARWDGAEKLLMNLLNFDAGGDQVEFWHIFQDEDANTTLSWLGLFPNLALATGLALRGLGTNERD